MNKSILILDDEKNVREKLSRFLENYGFTVHKIKDIPDLKNIVPIHNIDVAIVDLKIDYKSEYGGIDAINYIKRIQPKTKTIVLSAYQLDQNNSSGLESEIDGYIDKGGHENYITAVINKINSLLKEEYKKKCFVIMPFSTTASCTEAEWTEIFEKLIKPSVEKAGLNYTCKRSDAMIGAIIEGVLKDLNQADVVIADLTDRNANVFYELGVRQAIRDSTILIAQNKDDIPSDLSHQATHVYDWKLKANRKKFKARIKKILEWIEREPDQAKSPIKKYLSL